MGLEFYEMTFKEYAEHNTDNFELNRLKNIDRKESGILFAKFKCNRLETLEEYLREYAISDDSNYKNSVYVIKDKKADLLIAYFGLKCNCVVSCWDNETKEQIHKTSPWLDNDYIKNNDNMIVDGVDSCVEIAQFALNDVYLDYLGKHSIDNRLVGNWTFTNGIVPIIISISKYLGFSLLTVFAYNKDKVIDSYRKMGFKSILDDKEEIVSTMQDHLALGDTSEKNCIFMFQQMADIIELN